MKLLAIMLTSILFTCKITGVAAASWLVVFSPILALAAWMIAVLVAVGVVGIVAVAASQ